MSEPVIAALVALAAVLGAVALSLPLFRRCYVAVPSGFALVVNSTRDVKVAFTAAVVLPIVHASELLDLRVKSIKIEREGKHGLICRDKIRADIEATFFVRINRTAEDVTKVAHSVGGARASTPETLEMLFSAKFSEGLKTVAAHLDFEALCTQRDRFKDEVIEVIGSDLNGYVLEDLVIDFLDQTPLEQLDPNHILDAQGIKKITEATMLAQIHTAELNREREMRVGRFAVEATEAMLQLERQRADAFAAFKRDTGQDLTPEQLDDRLVERVRALVDEVVSERLAAP